MRFGNVSLEPDEPVPVDDGVSRTAIEAWLVEDRSWGGQSASPAFIWLQPMRYPGHFVIAAWDGDPGAGGILAPKDRVHLLGMVVGHFDLKADATFNDEASERALKTNSGVAIVVPAAAIRRYINVVVSDLEGA